MTLFEFVSVMFSIILGLSLSHTLSGMARLVRGSTRAVTFAPHTIWVGVILSGSVFRFLPAAFSIGD